MGKITPKFGMNVEILFFPSLFSHAIVPVNPVVMAAGTAAVAKMLRDGNLPFQLAKSHYLPYPSLYFHCVTLELVQ